MILTKTEICVPIRDEAELQQAKDMLEKNGEKIDEKYFNFKFKNIDANWIYLKLDNKGFWYIGKKHTTEIPLSELESVLKGESVEDQSSINEKQKAKELIETFYRYAKGQTNEARLINAKFSASYCVNEIIKDLELSFDVAIDLHPHAKGLIAGSLIFWQNVKTEIENYENI